MSIRVQSFIPISKCISSVHISKRLLYILSPWKLTIKTIPGRKIKEYYTNNYGLIIPQYYSVKPEYNLYYDSITNAKNDKLYIEGLINENY
jgi:hypothetical protein